MPVKFGLKLNKIFVLKATDKDSSQGKKTINQLDT
jgi:hypothetical protein